MANPFKFNPVVNDGSILVQNTYSTRFGGVDDKQDNGIGSWGFRYRDNPQVLGIALPMRTNAPGTNLSHSPLPYMKGLTSKFTNTITVRVFSLDTMKWVDALLVDLGPNGEAGEGTENYRNRGLDMTNSVVKALGLSLSQGLYKVNYRILGQGFRLEAMQREDDNS